jgi:ubiquinone/menaquinone biosynthesis C-methylase UbiE
MNNPSAVTCFLTILFPRLVFALGIVTLCVLHAESDDKTIYHSENIKSTEQAIGYSKTQESVSRYLAFRDIPSLIARYVQGKKALDDGAGTGLSAEFLRGQGLDVTGVDVSQIMLAQARITCPDVPFYLIQNGAIPLLSETYDLLFSSFVLLELASKKEILAYLEEAKRVMKKDGVLIAVTASQDAFSKDWLIYDANYPENKNLKSGDLAKVYLPDVGIEFTDYYWTKEDYVLVFQEAGLRLVEVHEPKGKEDEPYSWKDEKTSSPFIVLVAKILEE